MSYATDRSRNGSLADGMTDGTYKKLVRDRGGAVEYTSTEARLSLDQNTYGYQETSMKQMPDGTTRYTSGDVTNYGELRHQG